MAFAASERRRIGGSGLRSDRFITNVTRPSRRRASINSLDGHQPLSAGIRVSSHHLVPQSSCELLPMLVAGESRVDGDVWPGWGRRRPGWPSSRRTSTSGKSPESEGDALVACYGRIMHPPPQSATCRDLRGARAELAALGPGEPNTSAGVLRRRAGWSGTARARWAQEGACLSDGSGDGGTVDTERRWWPRSSISGHNLPHSVREPAIPQSPSARRGRSHERRPAGPRATGYSAGDGSLVREG